MTIMGVCRYFLQGTCRFGNNCRYEHTIPNYNSTFNSVGQHNSQLPRPQPQGQLNSTEFCDLVKHDLELSERSGQWSLSCYCPSPSKSVPLPGLDDYSPEEIRCLMYQAQASGNVEPCVQHIQKLYQDAQAKRNIFKSQSLDCKALLERASPSSGANPFLSGDSGDSANNSGRSIFQGSRGTFGGSSIPQVFGRGSEANPFGTTSAPSSSIFGGGSATTVNPFIGGQASPLDASAPQTQQGSIFCHAYTGQPSVFGGHTGGSSSSTTTTIFGGAAPAINSFSFAAAAHSLGSASPTVAPPTVVPASQPFVTSQASAAAAATAAPSIFAPSANPFGAPTQTKVLSIPAQRPAQRTAQRIADSGAHIAFNQLTEGEKAEFTAPTFSKGQIPLRPPPVQLCT